MSAAFVRARHLAVLAVLIPWLLVAPPPSPHRGGAAPASEVATQQIRLLSPPTASDVRAVGRSSRWATSRPIPLADTVLVGVEWDAGPAPTRLRTRSATGTWSPWQRVEPQSGADDQAPGPVSAPVWVGRRDAIQISILGGPGTAILHRVDMRGGGGLGYVPPEATVPPGAALAAPQEPSVVPRSSWDPDGECRPRRQPRYADRIDFAVVHHTAGSNDYSRQEVDDLVRAICLYHVRTNAWDDLGYNALVDRFGTVYEGRAGGIDRPVVGAHTSGFNDRSFGVAVLGNFVETDPPGEAVEALDRLLAWRLDLDHVDPAGTTDATAGRGTLFEAGSTVAIPTIVAHRDLNRTADPGRLYRWIRGEWPAGERIRDLGAPKLFGGPARSLVVAGGGPRPRWTVTATGPVDWRLIISDDTGKAVRSTGGVGASELSIEWDLRDEQGEMVAPGRYSAVLRTVPADATEPVATPIETELRLTPPLERLAGADRVATAVAVSRRAFPVPADRPSANTAISRRVVVAGSAAYPDALVAAPLAGSLDAPVLLVPPGGVPDEVAGEIRRLGASEAVLVGGEARLSTQVEADLERLGLSVERLAGSTRYQTAARVARRIAQREHPNQVVIALGEHPDPARAFPDALTAGGYGAARRLPVLLVAPDQLPAATRRVIEQRTWSGGVTVVGGPAAVSEDIAAAASEAARAPVARLAGADRYLTSEAAASETIHYLEDHSDEAATGWPVLAATGRTWPDALTTAAAAAALDGVLLLVDGGLDDPGSGTSWIRDRPRAVRSVLVAGGPAAVSEPAASSLEQAVQVASDRDPSPWPADPFR